MLHPFRLFLCLAVLFSASTFADTITLTTGEKVTGKVVRETDTEVTVEVKISGTITDERVIPRTEIGKIEKEMPEDLDWLPLMNLKPGVNSLAATQYDTVIRPLNAYVNNYPKSPHAAEANQLLAIFAGEKERVENGEVRLGEKWLTKEEVEKERYQIGGLLAFQFMRSQRTAGDLIGALNSFDQIEKNYPGCKSFPDAVEVAHETLVALKTTVENAQVTFKAQKAAFDAGVAASSAVQKPELLAARQRELAQGEAAIAAAEKAKIKWPTLIARSDKNLDAIAKKVTPELQRLVRFDMAKFRQSLQLAEEAQKDLADGNSSGADKVSKALAIWPANELAKRLQPEATALRIAAAATPVPVVATPTPKPSPTPKATPRPRPVLADLPPPEPEKPFLLTIGGMVTVAILLVFVIAGVVVYKKIKARSSDILE